MSANRCVQSYACPDEDQFDLEIPVGATFLGFIVRYNVEAVYEIDPAQGSTQTHTFKRVSIGEEYTAASHTWKGCVDFRGAYWFLVRLNP